MGIQEQYRSEAAALLSSGEVKLVIGFSAGSTADRRRPFFARTPEEAEKFVLDAACIANLSTYLVAEGLLSDGKKVGVFLKLDGIRSVNILISEAQLKPEQVVILGYAIENGKDVVPLEGRNISDFNIGEKIRSHTPPPHVIEAAEKIEAMSAQERFEFWKEEFAKCIKCYACRQVCPMCYCRRCIVDVNQPQWISTSSHTLGNFEWNLVRAFHLAGRCAACGACDRACPVNIPLRLLNYRMGKEVRSAFDYVAGENSDQKPVLASFKQDDPETFIL
ncbi:MAG TPA: 4Fe-4S ferredoxin [Chlorobaculum sp.]|uniref:Hydrogenase, iron-sulfur binding protein, putative n=1 Tax=Chlorobaculum tepidum (strain ATCC 49652 / DSM 12025 / NBRC 103806 / TLS) TaxID=194439 RepID=Q8KD09_CHLTE|nr:4Fe-4S dicluster domain-containing protein [Chlorobaculum tepidum]AAM72478.1 hydrogenase, iron-sulfur binding protein, putative [Chlorobaculum tepidum TLS]HBU23559.1 4Fe-4S ferredoxin [Chlorobaculum sp.]